MHNYNRYLSYQRFRELEADFKSMHGDDDLETPLRSLERAGSKLYTTTLFNLFRGGLKQSLILRVRVGKDTPTCVTYFVSKYCLAGRKWHVSLWTSTMDFKCSCMRMGSYGIPCDHIIAVMVELDMVDNQSHWYWIGGPKMLRN